MGRKRMLESVKLKCLIIVPAAVVLIAGGKVAADVSVTLNDMSSRDSFYETTLSNGRNRLSFKKNSSFISNVHDDVIISSIDGVRNSNVYESDPPVRSKLNGEMKEKMEARRISVENKYLASKNTTPVRQEVVVNDAVEAPKTDLNPANDLVLPNGLTKDTFDFKRYSEQYQDIAERIGIDRDALWNHYITYGIKENREAHVITPVVDNEFVLTSVSVDSEKSVEQPVENDIVKDSDDESAVPQPAEDKIVTNKPHLTKRSGVFQGPSGKETWYNLDMTGVINIMRRAGYSEDEYPYWVREDGCKMFGDYIMLAQNVFKIPRGTILETSLGPGMVCDHCVRSVSEPEIVDLAVNW